jgi:serine O-acetyltransferase
MNRRRSAPMGRRGAIEDRIEMFGNVRRDLRNHKSWRHRGFWALVVYRFGRWALEVRFGPARWALGKVYGVLNLFSEIVTGVVLQRTVLIGEDFHLIHPEGIRIHPGVVIGNRVGLMHRVTIGTNMGPGVPVIGNDVFIGCGATVLGRIRIGDGAHIAANSLVISDVPPGHTAVGVPAKAMPLDVRLGPTEPPSQRPRVAAAAARPPASV